jgi:F-type H+-transporting ATPase subunit b
MNLALLAVAAEGGFDPLHVGAGGLLWTIVIFAVSLPFMWVVVFGKISAALTERDSRAAEAIVLAERASAEAEKSRAAVEVALGEAQADAGKLLATARERAEARERDMLDVAKKESDAMIELARTQIQAEKEKALSAIRSEVVDLSLSAAGKVLGRRVDSEDDRRMVSELVTSAKVGER